ncbi:hypothetical protein [Bacillus sp. FJAT-22090]|uniref:hypothetical protein n=1 Tax=Bacillus sp. FJAT-22090 TaxID=1581038 RepID=UPI0011A0D065|nr:hypothetical protein [Bacillus sp. FJAT-22090]
MTKVNLDKLQAKSNGNIESVVGTVSLNNGALVALGTAVAGERELVNAVAPTDTAELLLVAAPEVKPNQSLDQLDYATPAGKAVRAYHLTEGDKFQVEQSLFDAVPNEGDVVTGNATYGYKVNADSRTTFVVERLTKFGYDQRPMALLRVLTV